MSAPAPIELVRPGGEDAPAAGVEPGGALVFVGVAIVAAGVLVVAHLRWLWHRRLSPSERAFRRLARWRGVRPRRRRVVRELAKAHGEAEPVALLVSDHAMRTAIERYRERAEAHAEIKSEDLAKLCPAPAAESRLIRVEG